ncbi:MAG: twin transmembrane helix small protein [Bauldia litoralis]
MSAILPIAIFVTLLAVVGVLLVGVVGMARGGEFNRKYGNKLMQARVALQALAVGLLFLLWLAFGK